MTSTRDAMVHQEAYVVVIERVVRDVVEVVARLGDRRRDGAQTCSQVATHEHHDNQDHPSDKRSPGSHCASPSVRPVSRPRTGEPKETIATFLAPFPSPPSAGVLPNA